MSNGRGQPPAQSGAAMNKGTMQCPAQVIKPCDVDKILLRVFAYDDNWTDGKVKADGQGNQTSGPGIRRRLTLKLEATTARRYRTQPPSDAKGLKLYQSRWKGDNHPATLLKSYDLIIDTIADSPKLDKASPSATPWTASLLKSLKPDPLDLVEIESFRGHFHMTANCGCQAHSLIKIAPRGSQKMAELPKPIVIVKPGANTLEKGGFKLSAPPLPFADLPSSTFPFFDLVKSIMFALQPREVEFLAQACGKRAKGDSKERQPNHDLIALLRIYRRDKWTIGIKVPPLGNYSDKREADKSADLFGASSGDSERKTEVGLAGGLLQRKTTDTVAGRNTERRDERWLAHKGWETSEGNLGSNQYSARRFSDANGYVLDQNGRTELSSPLMRLSRSSGFKVVVAFNDRELDLGEFYEKIKKGIELFAKLVTDFKNLFKLVPKVGWTFDFSVSVFEGWVGIEVAPTYVDEGAPIWDDRYCPVQYKAMGRIDLTIVNLKVTVGFGLEVKVSALGLDVVELVAKIEGSLEFKAKVAHDINMDLFKPKERFEVESSCVPALTAKASFNVVGYSLLNGQIGVEGGMEFKGCVELEWSARTFDLKGSLVRKPVILTGSIQYPGWFGRMKTKKIDPPIEIIEEGTIKVFH